MSELVSTEELRQTIYGSPTSGTKRGLRQYLSSRGIRYKVRPDGWPWTTREALNKAFSDDGEWTPTFAAGGQAAREGGP